MLILPPLLKRRFENVPIHAGNINWRYRNMEPYPRLFARYKLRLDPLFGELMTLVPQKTDVTNILDVGCGYGVPACWMLDRYPNAFIHGIDPAPERVRVAALALGDRGDIVSGSAPDLPPMDVRLDLVSMLDMSHFLQDGELETTLAQIHDRLLPGGCLIMRSVLPPPDKPHWTWHMERIKLKFNGAKTCYRNKDTINAILGKCRFEVLTSRPSA